VAGGVLSGIAYDGIPVEQLQERLSQKVHIDHFHVVVVEPNGWLIERRKTLLSAWEASVFFPLSLTHSALEFFVYELNRLRKRKATISKPFEGIRLVMMVDAQRVPVTSVAVGFTERVKKEWSGQ
jgi:hypothetical protein